MICTVNIVVAVAEQVAPDGYSSALHGSLLLVCERLNERHLVKHFG